MTIFGPDYFRDNLPLAFRPFYPARPRVVRDLHGLPPVLARAGELELRLATTKKEIRKAQRLRYEIFYDEGGAVPSASNALSRRDKCSFDRSCDHLLVIDTRVREAAPSRTRVVGTYRLMRDDQARDGSGFYSSGEFTVGQLLERHAGLRFLELGRSCVKAEYRSKRVIELLWRGIGIYAAHHNVDVLIGCSSLPGTAADELRLPLSYAHHFAPLDTRWQVEAVGSRALQMDRLPREAIDQRRAFATLPPLMKAYVRAGGGFAADAVVDHQFRTVDLFTVLPMAEANVRYLAQFGGALAASLRN